MQANSSDIVVAAKDVGVEPKVANPTPAVVAPKRSTRSDNKSAPAPAMGDKEEAKVAGKRPARAASKRSAVVEENKLDIKGDPVAGEVKPVSKKPRKCNQVVSEGGPSEAKDAGKNPRKQGGKRR